jgi:hypothetical protein
MKVGIFFLKKESFLYFLATFWKLSNKTLVIWNFLKFTNWRIFGPFLPMKNPFYTLKSYFSGQNLAKIHQ